MVNGIDRKDGCEIGFENFLIEEIPSYTARLLHLKSTAKHYHDRYLKKNYAYMKNLRGTRSGGHQAAVGEENLSED